GRAEHAEAPVAVHIQRARHVRIRLFGIGIFRRHTVIRVPEGLLEWMLFNGRSLLAANRIDFVLQLGELRFQRLDTAELFVKHLLQRRGLLRGCWLLCSSGDREKQREQQDRWELSHDRPSGLTREPPVQAWSASRSRVGEFWISCEFGERTYDPAAGSYA